MLNIFLSIILAMSWAHSTNAQMSKITHHAIGMMDIKILELEGTSFKKMHHILDFPCQWQLGIISLLDQRYSGWLAYNHEDEVNVWPCDYTNYTETNSASYTAPLHNNVLYKHVLPVFLKTYHLPSWIQLHKEHWGGGIRKVTGPSQLLGAYLDFEVCYFSGNTREQTSFYHLDYYTKLNFGMEIVSLPIYIRWHAYYTLHNLRTGRTGFNIGSRFVGNPHIFDRWGSAIQVSGLLPQFSKWLTSITGYYVHHQPFNTIGMSIECEYLILKYFAIKTLGVINNTNAPSLTISAVARLQGNPSKNSIAYYLSNPIQYHIIPTPYNTAVLDYDHCGQPITQAGALGVIANMRNYALTQGAHFESNNNPNSKAELNKLYTQLQKKFNEHDILTPREIWLQQHLNQAYTILQSTLPESTVSSANSLYSSLRHKNSKLTLQ